MNDTNFPMAASPQCILVAEDDPVIRRLNAEVLKNSGYRVDAATDGAVAWEALQTKSYDLLITDNATNSFTGYVSAGDQHGAGRTVTNPGARSLALP